MIYRVLLCFFCNFLKLLIKSSTDSNGVPGKGLIMAVDLFCRIHTKYFDLIAANPAILQQVLINVFFSLFVCSS